MSPNDETFWRILNQSLIDMKIMNTQGDRAPITLQNVYKTHRYHILNESYNIIHITLCLHLYMFLKQFFQPYLFYKQL